jgi:hypothetical protein
MPYGKYIKTTIKTTSIYVAAAAATLLMIGCLFSPPEPVPILPFPEMTSPKNVLKVIELAYNQRNINKYKDAMSTGFVFYFNPNDVGQSPPGSNYIIPDTWSYTEDWNATHNMFEKAHSIELTINVSRVGEPGPGDTKFRAENVSIDLLVMVDEQNGYHTDKGYCNFEFEKYTNSEGQPRWHMTKWWDYTHE